MAARHGMDDAITSMFQGPAAMITAPSTTSPALRTQGAQPLEAGFVRFAEGLAARFVNPLGAGPLAFGRLMREALVTLQTSAPAQPPRTQATWTAQLAGPNGARIDLGDGYRLAFDERNSEITIHNDVTGERTRIWGDPHVEIDGKHAYDFWGTTTFRLENGTKITINTEAWKGNPNMYIAEQVVITRGNNAIIVNGVGQNRIGDMTITQSSNGRAVDAAHRDGYVLRENATGAGWRTEHGGHVATQADLMATAIGAAYGPGSQRPSLGEANRGLSLFLASGLMAAWFITLVAAFNAPLAAPPAAADRTPEPQRPTPRPLA